MTDRKTKLLDKAYSTFLDVMLSDFPLDHLEKVAMDDVMGYGTAVDEKIHDLKGLTDLAVLQRKQSADMNFTYKLTPVFRKTMNHDNTAIIVAEIQISMLAEGEQIELSLRLSTVMDFIDGNWKVVHWHGSKPEYDSGGNDTWHREEWKQKNEELQKLVQEKTADLENKNRELEIESALERVRARTMAMQKSEELGDVAIVLFRELNHLVENLWTCGFVLCERDRDEDEWWLSTEDGFIPAFYLPNVGDKTHENIYNAWKKGETYHTEQVEGDDLAEHYEWLMNIPVSRKIFEDMEAAGMERPTWQKLHCAFFSSGYLVMITRVPCPEEAIFKRFAQVFDQTYTRFLDLKKAEEQAREAQIEAALERVRSRSMAMYKSEELADLSFELVKQVHALGVATWFCAFNIYDEDQKGSLEWGSNTEGTYEKYRTPREGIFLRYYEAGQRGDTFLINEIGENECPAHYDYLCSLPGVGDQLLKMKDAGISFPSSQIDHVAYFKYGYILFITFEPAPEAHDIFKRFAKVFEQTYTRFLDLQKAEAQAREAQIEAALERVRAKTMAMHNSQDVGNTVITLFDEVLKLGLDKSIRCGIGILDKATDHMETWSATSYSDGEVDLKMGLLDMKIHPMLIGLKKAWESGKSDYQYDYIGDDVLKYYKALNNEPEYPFQINLNSLPENEYHRSFFYTEGILFAFAPNPISEEAARVLNRFAGVFGQTYRRYLDLQKAEARELEAIKEASLDRVRAEIASMRTTQDLERITPLIWRELTTLNVPFFRCGVFIVNEEVEEVQVYLSNPTGDSLAAWHSDYKVLPLFRNTVKQWRLKKVYHTRWNRKEFIEFTQSLIDHGLLESPESYLDGEEAPASLDLQMVPFKQGMLYVGSAEALIGSQIEIVQSLADAFAVAYSRFDDFRQLENAKRRIETTLEELKDTQSQLVHAEKMASLGELTAGIAHEIQNPLNFVNNFSEVNSELLEELLEELDKGDLEEARIILEDLAGNEEKIKHHGKRADGIVRGMLQHSRTSQGEKEQTNINALADEYIRLAYHGLRAKDKSFNADFKLNFDENLPGINVIPQDIGRVLLNLINNAFYAVDKKAKEGIDGYKPEVIVSTKKLDDKIEISVKDNGDGIPEQVRDKIFQPFFTTKPTGSGTGLGLSLSYDIVKAHGGEIQVESKDGFGSEFIIFLPLKLE